MTFLLSRSPLRVIISSFCLSALLSACSSAPVKESAQTAQQIEFARVRMAKTALEQSQKISPDWDVKQRDCAGFVRFLFRDAVPRTSPLWSDRSGHQQAYLQAGALIAYNFEKVPEGERLEEERLQTGDVLVFNRDQQKTEDAWHLMVILKSPHSFQKKALVIYHNGDQEQKAEVRKVWLDDLKQAPFSEWRPTPDNPNFYGVYRWKSWL